MPQAPCLNQFQVDHSPKCKFLRWGQHVYSLAKTVKELSLVNREHAQVRSRKKKERFTKDLTGKAASPEESPFSVIV